MIASNPDSATLHLSLALVLAGLLEDARAQTIRVDITSDHATNTFRPTEALGAGVDRIPRVATDKVFTEPMIKQILSAGWQTVGYRQNTELFVEAWHWNPEGTWSGPGDKGYFVGNSTPIEFIRHSLGYPGAGDAGLVNAILTGPIQYLNPKTNGLQFFSASTFSNVVTAGYGTAPRNVLRGPGRTNLDLSLAKTTPLYRERITLELRVDAFNVLNHTEFNNLDNNAQDIGCAPAILVERTSAIESPAKREYDDCLNRVRHAMDTDNPSSHLPVFAAS